MRIAIIGAGASGLTAALHAARLGARITLFERNEAVGRKLLVTGSGRCNLTNTGVAAERYACAEADWMRALLSRFNVAALLEFLRSIGIPAFSTHDGWYYPKSESAHSVVESFQFALQDAGVSVRLSTQVRAIERKDGAFLLGLESEGRERREAYDRVIVAAGGKAYPTLGSRGELFPVLAAMGHTLIPQRPALAPVLAELKEFQALEGVRLDAGVQLWRGQDIDASTAGNLIFTKWGLNGPAVMDLSHHIADHPSKPQMLSIDWLRFHQADFESLLAPSRTTAMPLRVFLGAFFPPKVAAFLPGAAGLSSDAPMSAMTGNQIAALIDQLTDTRFSVKGVRGFEYCQVSAGGIPVFEADPTTLESRLVSGLFLTGETLDVVGPCGGFNLHYAFASGALAGMAVTRAPV